MVHTYSVILSILICGTGLRAMDDESQAQKTQQWSWYFTHLALYNSTKNFDCSITTFDPTVRIYDADTSELIVALQRIKIDLKNTDLADTGMSYKAHRIRMESNPEYCKDVLKIFDHDQKIMSLELDGINNKIASYDKNGKEDFAVRLDGENGFIRFRKCLIRLSPALIINPGPDGIEPFFKKLQEEQSSAHSN